MKTKLLMAVIFFITAIAMVRAEVISADQARRVARNFLHSVCSNYKTNKSNDRLILEQPFIYSDDGVPVFYAFNTCPGFIIISAEDCFTPVIGYSFEGRFELENAPGHYRGFIQNYIDQIRFIRNNSLNAENGITRKWEELLAGSFAGRDTREVAPLLQCKWNQGYPYNLLCPEDPAGPGGHTWVGCVATAMAQIMYYWRCPETGLGYNCYWPGNYEYGEQCAYFGETWYDWSGMINSVDVSNPYPNAELQYHCAVSVYMEFGPNGSGAGSDMVPDAMAWNFGYNYGWLDCKEYYDDESWMSLLRNELDISHPIYYCGWNDNWEGHAFVCDGYQGDYFHFNMGWGGQGNAYYSLYDIAGFHNGQCCITDIYPTNPDYPYYAEGITLVTERSGSLTDGSGPVENYMDNQVASWEIDLSASGDSIADITLTFSQFDLMPGDSVKVYQGYSTDDPLLGAFSGSELPPAVVATGDKMLITFQSDGANTSSGWYAEYMAHSAVYCNGLVNLTDPYGTIEDGSGTFNYHDNSTCKWRIMPPYANTITLTFNDFSTEDGVDVLTVFDGTTWVGSFSGNEIPDPVVATSGSIFLAWTTNSTNNDLGWSASYEIDNVGVPGVAVADEIKVYPNPANDRINVIFSKSGNDPATIRILNPAGIPVKEEKAGSCPGKYLSGIDIKEIPAGFYIVEMKSSFINKVEKLIIFR